MRSCRRPTPLPSLLLGAAYYPEHDTPEDLCDDIERFCDAYVNVVRMGDFAWDLIEPEDGVFDFGFLDEQIRRLGRANISTVLCTPTAAPPRWLSQKHPSILAEDVSGRRMSHGARQHASLSSPVFRRYCRRVVAKLAHRYSAFPTVIGWQIDNEFHCHVAEDYSGAAAKGFRLWLREKYQTIGVLNEAWGARFWAQTWPTFQSIDLPRADRPTHVNPHQWLDFQLYLSDAACSFQNEQVEILNSANPKWWITHNGFFRNIDYRKLAATLSFLSLDLYPQFAAASVRSEWAARKLSQACSFAGNFLVTELQSGPGAQGDYCHERPEPGQMRLWAWQSIAHGADGVIFFRWRSCRFGAEQYWEGIIDHDNRLRGRYEELKQLGGEFRKLSSSIIGSFRSPQIAILYDTGLLEMAHYPVTHGLPSPGQVGETLFATFRKHGYDVGFVSPFCDLADAKVVIVPSMAVITAEVVKSLEAWTAAGGTLVITARSGRKDARGHVVRNTPPGILAALAGCHVDESTRIHSSTANAGAEVAIKWADQTFIASEWGEVLTPTSAKMLAEWRDGRKRGRPAATLNSYGTGQCIYIGTYPTSNCCDKIAEVACAVACVSPVAPNLPAGLEIVKRAAQDGCELLFLLNHTDAPIHAPSLDGRVLLGGGTPGVMDPFGVRIIHRPQQL